MRAVRTGVTLLAVLMLLMLGLAEAQNCVIDDIQDVSVGPNRAIRGICSNNGFDIECNWSPAGGITCIGPQGDYNGQDLAALVSAACGCG